MAININLNSFGTLTNPSIIATLNANNTLITAAFANALSLTGTSPNQMNTNLDMNGNQIVNLPAGSTINSPARLADLEQVISGTGAGAFALLNGNNSFSGTNTFPTQPTGQNDNTVATTAFVQAHGLPNINDIASSSLIPDGKTSNTALLFSVMQALSQVSPGMVTPVNVTVGNPTVLSINPTVASGGQLANPAVHFFKPNQAFKFVLSSGGVLPAGLSLSTTYYITSANMTGTTFTFSTTNNYGLLPTGASFTSEGSTVASSGSASGVNIQLYGEDVDVFIPPGTYFGGNFGDSSIPNLNVTPNGVCRIRYHAYGAQFDTKTSFGVQGSAVTCLLDPKTWTSAATDFVTTTPNDNFPASVDGIITLVTTANAANYFVGQWISIFGLNIQDSYNHAISAPPNTHYQEFKRIKSINTGSGTLTVDGPLKWNYLSTFPQMFTPHSTFVAPGNASITAMHPAWDTDITVLGARWNSQSIASGARRIKFKDCTYRGFGAGPGIAVPSGAQQYIFEDCRFLAPDGSDLMQIDKMAEYVEFTNCWSPNSLEIAFESPTVHVCKIKNHTGSNITGTPRQVAVTDSEINQYTVGPFIGVTDSATFINNRLNSFIMTSRNDDGAITPNNDMVLVPNWTFSNGTFTRNISNVAGSQGMLWQITGAKIYMRDAGLIFKPNQNMGSPFTILNVTMDGSGNFSFDTTLQAVPTRQTSHTVTITNASPGVVSWSSNGLANGTPVCFNTTGTLPLPLLPSTMYYVVNTATNTFQVALTVGGAAINTTTAGSGTHTAYGNPLAFRPHPCPRFTSIGNGGCAALIDLNGSIDEPLFSRAQRSFVGKQSTQNNNPTGFQQPNSMVWGNLISMTVNVAQAGTASGTLTISSVGFSQPNIGNSNFSAVIDTTTAGVRTITNASGTTSSELGADSFTAYSDWLAGPLLFQPSAGVTLPNSALVYVTVRTDQGITRFSNMMGGPVVASAPFLWQYIDSGINQIID